MEPCREPQKVNMFSTRVSAHCHIYFTDKFSIQANHVKLRHGETTHIKILKEILKIKQFRVNFISLTQLEISGQE